MYLVQWMQAVESSLTFFYIVLRIKDIHRLLKYTHPANKGIGMNIRKNSEAISASHIGGFSLFYIFFPHTTQLLIIKSEHITLTHAHNNYSIRDPSDYAIMFDLKVDATHIHTIFDYILSCNLRTLIKLLESSTTLNCLRYFFLRMTFSRIILHGKWQLQEIY